MSAPHFRAILGPNGFVVVPWHERLAYSKYAQGPIKRNTIVARLGGTDEDRHHGPDPQIFAAIELWLSDDRAVGRHIGSRALRRDEAAALLAQWVQQTHGLKTEIGPDLPDWLPAPARLELPTVVATRPAAFRFTDRDTLDLWPWGLGAPENTERLPENWPGAVGEVQAIDDDHATATFAWHGTCDRGDVVQRLHAWARADDWQLQITDGLQPLTYPATEVRILRPGRCSRCATTVEIRFAFGVDLQKRGYAPTRCHLCGGRVWWHAR